MLLDALAIRIRNDVVRFRWVKRRFASTSKLALQSGMNVSCHESVGFLNLFRGGSRRHAQQIVVGHGRARLALVSRQGPARARGRI